VEELNARMRSTEEMVTSTKLNTEDVNARTVDNHKVFLNITWGRTLCTVVAKLNNEPNNFEGCVFIEGSCPMLKS